VQDSQINAIAPWSLKTGQTVQICVVYQSAMTNCLSRTVAKAHPGAFTVDGYYAAAVNQDGTVNSAANPAQLGSVVSIFATGLGPLYPQPQDGAVVGFPLPTETLPIGIFGNVPTATFGLMPQPLAIQYAGPAPYQVAGVSQINFVVGGYSFWLTAGGDGDGGGPSSAEFQVYVAQ
jgi:uncharacterized protein (TIGR03437 family)